ncbi:MAG: FtsX-like permease family protein [Vicinamibacterales bacterium]
MLTPGATAAGVSAELQRLTAAMTAQGLYHPNMRFSAFAVGLDDEVRGGIAPAMWLLSGAVACLLLVACANVTNLLLVRGDSRAREIAVRSALGATSDRLVRQLIAEGLVLALTGAAFGLALASVGVRVLLALDPTSLPPLAPVRLDLAVVAFTTALAVLTTLLIGVVPAIRAQRGDVVTTLRRGSPRSTGGAARHRLRGLLVVTEVTLAVVLVVGAALMGRTLGALGRIPLGFAPDQVLTLRLSLPATRYATSERVTDAYRRVIDDLRGLPGVTAAGLVRALPLATTIGDWAWTSRRATRNSRAATPRATGRSSAMARSRRWAYAYSTDAPSPPPTPPPRNRCWW